MPTNGQRIIVTCTTLPSRCEHVVDAARSILNGIVGVDKFVLNVFKGDFVNGIPAFISNFAKEDNRFEIYVSDVNYWSATKLVPSISRFPDDILVAVDEDKEYQPTLIKDLLARHEEHPKCVISMKSEKIRDCFGTIQISTLGVCSMEEDMYMIPCTGGGVLFPPHVFDGTHVADSDMFLKWQKPHDDRWWWMNYTMNSIKAISAVKWTSDRQFSKRDFVTKDAIHDFLWVPRNIRSLDDKCVEWLKQYSPKVFFNIPKLKINEVVKSQSGIFLKDELGRTLNYPTT